jgi:hypothetical protein
MKTKLFALLLLTFSYSVSGQDFKGERVSIVIEGHSMHATLKKDSLSVVDVKEFFNFTDVLFTGKSKMYDRYLYTSDATYYRPGMSLFRKPTIYKKVNGDFVKIKS